MPSYPLGPPVAGWSGAAPPAATPMTGRACRLEPLEVRHADDLFAAGRDDVAGATWTYLSFGPWRYPSETAGWVESVLARPDVVYFAVVEQGTNQASGVVAYLRVRAHAGSIEVGGIWFSPILQRTTAATEAVFVMLRRAFDECGYRRCEWKCNALNAASLSAARRLGFTFEGTFRQDDVMRGRSRDTSWFSLLDSEWPQVRDGLQRWLEPSNFTAEGRQRTRLRVQRRS